ncbi:endonuclease-reverse transcriptase [Plakobranchus ocellatus]|uniref:Endonuclease-reverse transcriptase n=1 Tax=Plakobranchus ocellatus TaxID=259542 RepID=A0AAV4BCC7_9GAST|nr:endonuclease-reverse transcriptase [Plakobranchus ocellatus]
MHKEQFQLEISNRFNTLEENKPTIETFHKIMEEEAERFGKNGKDKPHGKLEEDMEIERWAGQIAREKDNRWTKRCIEWQPRSGRRDRGRPEVRWMDDIRKAAGPQWQRKAQDRRKGMTSAEGYILQWIDKASKAPHHRYSRFDGDFTFKEKAPDMATIWSAKALCVSQKKGFGMSEGTSLNTFKPFFLSFNMPYAAARGKKRLAVRVTVHITLHRVCIPVILEWIPGHNVQCVSHFALILVMHC